MDMTLSDVISQLKSTNYHCSAEMARLLVKEIERLQKIVSEQSMVLLAHEAERLGLNEPKNPHDWEGMYLHGGRYPDSRRCKNCGQWDVSTTPEECHGPVKSL